LTHPGGSGAGRVVRHLAGGRRPSASCAVRRPGNPG